MQTSLEKREKYAQNREERIIQNYYTSFCRKRKERFQEKRPDSGVRSGKPGGRKMPAAHKTRPAGQKVLRQGGCFWCCFGRFTGYAPG